MKSFESNRLIIRPFIITDAKTVQQLAGDRAIADTTLNIPHPYEDGMAEEWIASHHNMFETGQEHPFAIIEKQSRSLIGAISLINVIRGHQAELGYWMGLPFWKQGFCTEAARAILQYAFIDLGLQRVHACYLSRNKASGRVMQKLGMKHEGTRRNHVQKWGKLENIELYGILRNEWEETANKPSAPDR